MFQRTALLAVLIPFMGFGLGGSVRAVDFAQARAESIGRPVARFALADYLGSVHKPIESRERLIVLAFLGVECPLAQQYGPILQQLADEFTGDVAFYGINANRHDSPTEIGVYVRKVGVRFPLLKDTGNRVADQLAAERTPEVILLDKQRRIRDRGRIDDQYGVGYARDRADRRDLREAIEALLAGREIAAPLTDAVGCHIGRIATPDENAEVTYSGDVAAILNRHCAECHRPGEIGPFSLTDYEEVVGWAETIEEVVLDGRMPPWHADPSHGEFLNARRMRDEEKQLISRWVEAGAPLGDPDQVPETPPPPSTEWRTPRPPDLVLSMRDKPFRVPANGVVEYQYFVVDPGFKEDKWVSAAEVIPGNRRVVHHAIVFIKPPKPSDMRGFGWLTAYVPGQALLSFPDGLARKIPAGSQLIFQMHYTPVGSPQEDVTRLGLVFADASAVEEEAFTMLIMNREFEIPPHAASHQVSASRDAFPEGAKLRAIAPHMHLRGKSFEFRYRDPDGDAKILLQVPRYDFNWQHSYQLREPIALRPGAMLECVGTFDNSDANLLNPDPSQSVRWGDQTFQEMMLGYLELSAPLEAKREDPKEAERRASAERVADDFISRFDKNGDGRVASHETPSAFSTFAFRRIDANADKLITRAEAIASALNTRRRFAQRERNP